MNALRERVVLAFVREYRAAVADGDRKTVMEIERQFQYDPDALASLKARAADPDPPRQFMTREHLIADGGGERVVTICTCCARADPYMRALTGKLRVCYYGITQGVHRAELCQHPDHGTDQIRAEIHG